MSEKIALFAAFFHAINGLVLETASGRITTDHVDTLFAFFIELGIFFSFLYKKNQKTSYLLSIGGSLGAAILCKWLVGMIILPVFIVLNFEKNLKFSQNFFKLFKASSLVVGVAAIFVLPWQWYIFKHYPLEAAWEAQYNLRHWFEVIETHGSSWWYHLDKARIIWNELIYVAVLWFVWEAWQQKNKNYFALLVWIALPYLFFSLAQTKMQGYLLFTGAAIFIILAIFISKMQDLARNTTKKYLKIAYTLVYFAVVALACRYSIERIKPFQNNDKLLATKNEILKKSASLPAKSVLFNCPYPIELMFYSQNNVVAYEYMPSETVIEELKRKGYQVYIFDKSN